MKKQVLEAPDYYIYDDGRLESVKKGKSRFLKGEVTTSGYLRYLTVTNGKKTRYFAHQLVATYFIENPNHLSLVNHKDGNKLNNHVDNLEWSTIKENTKHAFENNLVSEKRKREYYEEDLDNEIWKEIPYLLGKSVSSCGRIKNDKTNLIYRSYNATGYESIKFNNKHYRVHKIVYSVFNNEDYNCEDGFVIDHIDGNKINNCLNNLRKISLSENVLASYYEQKTNNHKKKVAQYDLNNKLLNTFESYAEAARKLNLSENSIGEVARGRRNSLYGYKFKLINND